MPENLLLQGVRFFLKAFPEIKHIASHGKPRNIFENLGRANLGEQ
jgi:hypothetical protein